MPNKKIYRIKHGTLNDTMADLAQQVEGAHWNGQLLSVDSKAAKVQIACYSEIPGIEIATNEVWFDHAVVIKDDVHSSEQILMRFIHESVIYHQKKENAAIGAGNFQGASMYNTLMPMEVMIPGQQTVRWVSIRLSLKFWQKYSQQVWPELENMISSNNEWCLYESLTLQMEDILRDIFVIQQQEMGRRGLSLAKGLELFSYFFIQLLKRQHDKNSIGSLTVNIDTLFEIKEQLLSNLLQPPTNKQLALTYGMSLEKLRSNFKKVFGMPPHQFVLRERYKEAYRQVTTTKLPLTTIALSLGFSHSSHFTNGFKKHFGMTPTSLRAGKLSKNI